MLLHADKASPGSLDLAANERAAPINRRTKFSSFNRLGMARKRGALSKVIIAHLTAMGEGSPPPQAEFSS